MSENAVTIQKKKLYGFVALIVVVVLFVAILFGAFTDDSGGVQSQSAAGSELRFAELSAQATNQCSGSAFIDLKDDSARLQGACCGAMDFHRYSEQVEGLKKYSHIDKIPADPYDVPVSLARELLAYQKSIQLTSEQQAVYGEAMKMSHEGGPCCCKCWRWYAFEGLAKHLITEYDFSAEQIADVWDLEDGCGGSGHEGHGTQNSEHRETFEPFP